MQRSLNPGEPAHVPFQSLHALGGFQPPGLHAPLHPVEAQVAVHAQMAAAAAAAEAQARMAWESQGFWEGGLPPSLPMQEDPRGRRMGNAGANLKGRHSPHGTAVAAASPGRRRG